jgi:hypothetical protein
MPSRKAKASTGVMAKIKGSIIAIAPGLPMPGRMPTTNPAAMPSNINMKVE